MVAILIYHDTVLCQHIQVFSSEATGPFEVKLHVKPLDGGTKSQVRGTGPLVIWFLF